MEANYNIHESDLIRYFSGDITPEERSRIEDWINHSDANRKIARQVYYICFATDTLQTMQKTDARKALAHVSKEMKLNRPVLWKKRLQQIAAVLFIPLFLSTLYLTYSSLREQTQHMISIRSNPGMITSITLPDSTKVWLNSDSYLSYPMVFKGNTRSVELIGEAYFDVKKDTQRKFTVNTPGNMQVEVLGTAFNVEAYNHHEVVTTLVSGKVNLVYMNADNQKHHVLMSPNQMAVYDPATKMTTIQSVRVDPAIAWKDGKVIFHDTPLEDALKILSKRFHVEFVIKNPKLKEERFTGTFTHQRLDVILQHFNVSSNIKFRYVDPSKDQPIPDKMKIEIY